MKEPELHRSPAYPAVQSHPRQGGFSLLEVMLAAAIVALFASSAFTAMTVTNSLAVSTRNQTVARAMVTAQISEVMNQPWRPGEDTTWFNRFENGWNNAENVTVWQWEADGNSVEIPGILTTDIAPDGSRDDTRVLTVNLTYTFRGRDLVLETSTIRAKDI